MCFHTKPNKSTFSIQSKKAKRFAGGGRGCCCFSAMMFFRVPIGNIGTPTSGGNPVSPRDAIRNVPIITNFVLTQLASGVVALCLCLA